MQQAVEQARHDFYPTKTQREKTLEIDSQLLEILNRARDTEYFVARNVTRWAQELYCWPECSDAQRRESFVRERLGALLRLGIIGAVERTIDGITVRGFVIYARRNEKRSATKWSEWDAIFLREMRIDPEDGQRPILVQA
jgi:hypothetical protein